MNSARYLTSAYVFALSLVAVSSLAAYCMMSTLIETQEANATLINIAGRQRRLSQQIALNSLRLSENRSQTEKNFCRRQLAEAINLMADSHQALSQGSRAMGLPGKLSQAVKTLYFAAPTRLDAQVHDYLQHARRVLAESQLSRENGDLNYLLTAGPTTLVNSLDTLVKQYELDSNAEIKQIHLLEAGTLIFTLLLLSGEAIFIFRPMAVKINKQMQDLLDSQKELKAVFNTVGEALLTMDGQSSIVTANDQVQILWGHGKSDLVGKSLHDLFCKEGGPIAVNDAEIYGKRMEMQCIAKDGREFPVELLITKTALSDRELFTLSARDISALKKAEREVSEFYSVVSHELRTPLTAICGALGLMEGGMVGDLPEETREFVSIARVEADRMTKLVNDILDLRKLAAGRLQLKVGNNSLRAIVCKAIGNLEPALAEAKLKIDLKFDNTINGSEQDPLAAYCDSDRTVQILENLLTNAIKFSPAGSTIGLTLSQAADAGFYRLSVQDNGPGIAGEEQAKIFEVFRQLDSSDTRSTRGSGLGLAIAKAIVEKQGGHIGVESKAGEGCTFWFELPAVEPAGQLAKQ